MEGRGTGCAEGSLLCVVPSLELGARLHSVSPSWWSAKLLEGDEEQK